MLVLIACLVLCGVLLAPYIKRAWERLVFFKEVKKICALKMYKVNIPKPFCAYFCNVSDCYDITVDTGKTFYALKLWSEFYRHSALYFNKSGAVMKKRKVTDPLSQTGKRTHSVIEKRAGSVGRLSGADVKNRKVVKVFIISPRELDIFICDKEGARKATSADRICDMIPSTYKVFLKNLGN
ncbi:MAG: hypothetical protein E7679_06050 [Ruminococcaceae bacterium]|nr:hypothetical protein [Oscillospiraceae bacterium]